MRSEVGQTGNSSYVTGHHCLGRKDIPVVAQRGNLASVRISEKTGSVAHNYKRF